MILAPKTVFFFNFDQSGARNGFFRVKNSISRKNHYFTRIKQKKNAFFRQNTLFNQKTARLIGKLSSLATCQNQSELILSYLSMLYTKLSPRLRNFRFDIISNRKLRRRGLNYVQTNQNREFQNENIILASDWSKLIFKVILKNFKSWLKLKITS